jgi:hypothetical protein
MDHQKANGIQDAPFNDVRTLQTSIYESDIITNMGLTKYKYYEIGLRQCDD